MKNQINILVVDDEQIILDSISRHFRNETTYNLKTVLTVEEALSIIDSEKIDILLTDLMMPEIDGLELTKLVKSKKPNIFIIMITGYATINTALQAMQLGAFDYLAKPFTRDELKKVVARASELISASENSPNSIDLSKRTIGSTTVGKYSWIMKEENGSVLIGVERTFIIGIGKIQTVYLPEVGDEIRQGSVCFQAFSTDLRSQSLMSPLSGTVLEVNQKIIDNPSEMLQDPYGQGWIMRIKPSNFDEEIKVLGL